MLHKETSHIVTAFVLVLIVHTESVPTYIVTDLTHKHMRQDMVINMRDINHEVSPLVDVKRNYKWPHCVVYFLCNSFTCLLDNISCVRHIPWSR